MRDSAVSQSIEAIDTPFPQHFIGGALPREKCEFQRIITRGGIRALLTNLP
jgi:hypothetical protein